MRTFASLVLVAVTPVLAGFCEQVPFTTASGESSEHYQFKHTIRRVAIIGAGVGGLIAYREVAGAGFDVHLYERDSVPGGNWHYSAETPVETSFPSNPNVALNDYIPSLPPAGVSFPYVEEYHGVKDNEYRKRAHRAPKPIWNSLTSNAPAPIQQIREIPWPVGTPWALPNLRLQGYLRAFASYHGLNSNDGSINTSYNTRLELAEKRHNKYGEEEGWTLTLKTLESRNDDTVRATWRKEVFDALVVATGRYNAPNVPRIAGLEAWAERFPGHIFHSRQYRHPEEFAGETVLIIGAATSGAEISRDIIKDVKKVYQSIRPDTSPIADRPQRNILSRLPKNVTIVPEIRRFLSPTSDEFTKAQVELVNGTIITGLDRVLFATGYRYTYPFLPQYHNASLGLNDTAPASAGKEPIVTDGTHLRALYLDAFYIPDPTLLFINANFGMQSFTYAEFVSLAAAKIWSRTADFPNTQELWRRYEKLYKQRKGYGRHFQFLGAQGTKEALRFFQGWLNDAASKYGGRTIDGLSKDLEQVSAIWSQARYGTGQNAVINGLDVSASSIFGPGASGANGTTVTGQEAWVQDAVYNDYW